MTTRLNTQTVTALGIGVAIPRYDRSKVTPGIVHIGVGGFHRAHEAVYLDDLMAVGGGEWGICGVGLRTEDKPMQEALVPQDCLYTVMTRSAEGDEARVIGSLVRYLFAPEEEQAFQAVLAAPETRIVSLTITEGGYGLRSGQPEAVFRYLTEALAERRHRSLPAFTVLSCDNLPHNGDAAKHALLAAVTDPELADWIEQNTAFPNSMVDRITPQTTDADRVLVGQEFGIEDAWLIVCEPFRQWIIEDKFSSGRPALEQVGVQFVADVAPYETMKLSLLNGSHFAMAYLGFLAGFRTVPEVTSDPLFRLFVERFMDEVTPLLPPVPGLDLTEYKAMLIIRFANPAIKDQIARLCLDGSSKAPKFLLHSLHAALETGRPHRLMTLALAGWMRYLRGVDEQGNVYALNDPRAAELTERALLGGTDPRPLLDLTDIFGDLEHFEDFVSRLEADLKQLSDGARKTVASRLS